MATFGFSAGDLIAGINLIKDIIVALNGSRGAGPEYRELIDELYTLKKCLIEVKSLDLDDSQHAQLVAIRSAAGMCQRSIDAFGKKLVKYQPSLRTEGSGNLLKDSWKKVSIQLRSNCYDSH